MENLSQHSTFLLIDDDGFSNSRKSKNSKLFLIDPYDYETLQVFFDCNLSQEDNKIDIVDVVNFKQLDLDYCLDKFVVDVDMKKAITDSNFFFNKLDYCEKIREKEILSIGVRKAPIQPRFTDFDVQQEKKNLSGDKYLQMCILPLLHSVF